ncbi:hypothetical protein D3C80_2040510 [compost metagenome]
MWRAKYGEALDFTPIKHFSCDQPCFNGFTDTNIVSDQKANHFVLERHQQRHQLVGSGLDIDAPERAERASSSAQF